MKKQAELKQLVKQAFDDLSKAYASIELIEARIRFFQRICDHSETTRVSHTGHLFTKCIICEKEW